VSRLVGDIDKRVNAFLTRPIEGEWRYVWIDATYVWVCQGGRIVNAAVIVATGANTEGGVRAGRRSVRSRTLLEGLFCVPSPIAD
jgi:transposase-like protein